MSRLRATMAINAETQLRRAYKGGVWPALRPGDLIDVNSAYPVGLGMSDVLGTPAQLCTLLGHARHYVAGVLQPECLRCGEAI